jgi:pyridoxal phosphate enzyme (YggS family)
LIVVTKFHPASLVRELAELGVRDVGENKHQEAVAKHAECVDVDVNWHFIGQLQSNKAAAVRAYADAVHSVDRPSLVTALENAGKQNPDAKVLDCFVQVNLTDDPGRGGVAWADIESLAVLVCDAPSLRLAGVMAVAPLDADPREAFARVAQASEIVRSVDSAARSISAGMSHDYEAAIEAGATHLRIGTQITGKRPTPG